MLIAGIVCVALGAVLLLIRGTQSARLYQLQSTETSTAAQLAETAKAVVEGVGKGSFVQRVELKGDCRCESPLRAEFSGTPCVYYSVSVTREYEETVSQTDSQGKRTTSTRRGSEVVQSGTRSVRFELEDATGRVAIVPDGAEFTGEKSYSQYQPGEPRDRNLRIGSFSFGIPMPVSGRRTIGYRYEESSIPVGRRLYVLGEVDDGEGALTVRKPSDKKEKFLVSVKSEEELVASAKAAVTWLGVGAVVLAIAGVALAVASFLVA